MHFFQCSNARLFRVTALHFLMGSYTTWLTDINALVVQKTVSKTSWFDLHRIKIAYYSSYPLSFVEWHCKSFPWPWVTFALKGFQPFWAAEETTNEPDGYSSSHVVIEHCESMTQRHNPTIWIYFHHLAKFMDQDLKIRRTMLISSYNGAYNVKWWWWRSLPTCLETHSEGKRTLSSYPHIWQSE